MIKKLKGLLLTNQTIRQTIFKNTFWLTVSNIGGRLLRAIIIIYGARILGAHNWGIFSYVLSLTAFLTIFTDFGITPLLTRENSKIRNGTNQTLVATSFGLKLILLVLAISLMFAITPSLTNLEGINMFLPFAALILAFDTLREFGFSLIRAREKMEMEAFLFIFTNVAIVLGGFIWLEYKPTALALAYAYALGTGLGAAATFFILRNSFKNLHKYFVWQNAWPILRTAWPFALSGLLGGIMINTDTLLIGLFRSAEELGWYSVAQRPIQMLYLLPIVLASSLFPLFARLANENRVKLGQAIQTSTRILLLVGIPIAVGAIITAKPLINLVFGVEYARAVPSFTVLALTLLINFPAVLLSNVLFAADQQKTLVRYFALGAGVNILLDLLFIPNFGIVGSAWATLFSQVLSNLYLWYHVRKITSFRILPELPRIILATSGMAIYLLIFKLTTWPILLIISGAILIYFTLIYLLKEPLLKELKLILR